MDMGDILLRSIQPLVDGRPPVRFFGGGFSFFLLFVCGILSMSNENVCGRFSFMQIT